MTRASRGRAPYQNVRSRPHAAAGLRAHVQPKPPGKHRGEASGHELTPDDDFWTEQDEDAFDGRLIAVLRRLPLRKGLRVAFTASAFLLVAAIAAELFIDKSVAVPGDTSSSSAAFAEDASPEPMLFDFPPPPPAVASPVPATPDAGNSQPPSRPSPPVENQSTPLRAPTPTRSPSRHLVVTIGPHDAPPPPPSRTTPSPVPSPELSVSASNVHLGAASSATVALTAVNGEIRWQATVTGDGLMPELSPDSGRLADGQTTVVQIKASDDTGSLWQYFASAHGRAATITISWFGTNGGTRASGVIPVTVTSGHSCRCLTTPSPSPDRPFAVTTRSS
ncbi:UNVERIFIED_ORG: hypothetical protein FHR35_009113 [Microbispora rosea subsp. rosea]